MSPRAYRLGARSVSVEETRARVVSAAAELFTTAGYDRTSLDAVAAKADVARATVYHQFGSKIGLLEAVVRDLEMRAGLPALVAIVDETPPDRLLREVVAAGCRYWATDPQLVRTVSRVAATDPDAAHLVARHDANRLEILRRMVARLVRHGHFAVGVGPQEALDVLWVVTGFAAYDLLADGRGRSTGRAARTLGALAESRLGWVPHREG